MLRFHLITLFPEACEAYLAASIIGRARTKKLCAIAYQSPRPFVDNKWGKVDERPYGGGPGMVMAALPVIKAVKKALARRKNNSVALVWFSPGAKEFTNTDAEKLMAYDDVVLVCGRYEGIDERARTMLGTFGTVKVFSVGRATYTGGEIPALAIVDATVRRIPGVLGNGESLEEARPAASRVYTRPDSIAWEGKTYKVPTVLTTGDHAKIVAWRTTKGKRSAGNSSKSNKKVG